jgi:hypothetical protein
MTLFNSFFIGGFECGSKYVQTGILGEVLQSNLNNSLPDSQLRLKIDNRTE